MCILVCEKWGQPEGACQNSGSHGPHLLFVYAASDAAYSGHESHQHDAGEGRTACVRSLMNIYI